MEGVEMTKFWQDRRVFVTGASGLVGSWLVEDLLQKGADVVILLRDWVPKSNLVTRDLLTRTTVVRGDLSDSRILERILAEYEIESVMHLAAQTIVPIANKNPMSTFESNIAGTWNLLEASRHTKTIQSVVIASSDKAYGEAPSLPYEETMPLSALYPYDVSKACADMIAQSYAKTFKLPVAITRCGNFFGGGDLNWNRLIPGTIRSLIRNKAPVIRSDGSLIRDYIYVEDAVSAYITLTEALSKNPALAGEAFNFSNETQRTVLELTNSIIGLMDSSIEPIIQGENQGEIQAQYLDSTKATRELGWKATFGINEGLARTIAWYKDFFERDSYA